MKPSNPDTGLPTADDVRGIIPRSTPAQDATALTVLKLFVDVMDANGNWDDGCFYYGGRSASELQRPIELAKAVRRATSQTPDALRSTLEDIIAVYEWCSVDTVDRGYSALGSEIHRAKHLLSTPSTPSASASPPAEALERCALIAEAIDSGRGNEKQIAKAIRELKEKGYGVSAHPQPQQAGVSQKPVCCYCDNILSCAHCGREQPDDSEPQQADGRGAVIDALKKIVQEANAGRHLSAGNLAAEALATLQQTDGPAK